MDVETTRYVEVSMYLQQLFSTLAGALDTFSPDLVIWIAGADNHSNDRFGQMHLSLKDMQRRDEVLLRAFIRNRVPVAVLLDVAYLRYSLEDEDWWAGVDRMLEHGTVLFAWSASKAVTQYGARVGALVGLHRSPAVRDEMARAFNFAARGTWSACNHGGQMAIHRLLSEPTLAERTDRERGTLRGLLSERWSAFSEAASAAGLRTPSWSGGFFTCLRTGAAQSVAERLMSRDVFVVPVPGAVRVAICATPAGRMGELVTAVAAEM